MKLTAVLAALALAIPATAVAQASSETHKLAWHPNGKTPSAIPQLRSKQACVEAANHHKGSKGPVTPVVRCSNSSELAQAKATPEAVERGE
jgi:hypothetical protein